MKWSNHLILDKTHIIIVILLFHKSPFNYPIYFRYNALLQEFFCVFLLLWDHEICIYKNVLLVVKIFGFRIRTTRKIEKEILQQLFLNIER